MTPQTRRVFRYIAHCVPGLEAVAEEEIVSELGVDEPVRVLREFDERTSMLIFSYSGPAAMLCSLNTVEDVFALAVETKSVPASRSGLATIRAEIGGGTAFGPAVQHALLVRPRKRGKTTFRVIARKSGEHSFRRVDMQTAVERALVDRFPAWRPVGDDAQLEVWVHLVHGHFLAGIRLSDGDMRNRTYRVTSLPAALKPTVARAMVRLSQPRDDDVVLDPMCGSGTILIERARTARYRLLLGGDSDVAAVQATRDNVGPKYKPIEIRQWDARTLPLADTSVSVVLSNLPFGKQIGTPEENRTLYPQLIDEWVRVLTDDGRMVLLTGDRALLLRALQRHAHLRVAQQLPVLVRGYRASLVVVHGRTAQ